MLFQVATLYGDQSPMAWPLAAKAVPTSTTSGARLCPLVWEMAFSSSWLVPSGFSSVILIPYLASNFFMIVP
jgi:hypothetical protein